MIRIIHISDLHLEKETPSFEKSTIINALAEDLTQQVNEDTLLLLTGDLIDKGALNFSDKSNAFHTFEKVFVDPILLKNPGLKGRIFFVPGNHDIYRDKIDKYSESGLKSELSNVKVLDAFIQSNRINSKHLDRLETYKKWESDFISALIQKSHQTLSYIQVKHWKLQGWNYLLEFFLVM